ncbi:hypothetical protein C2E23DRAFT_845563 [Lenzites betulinus]|nr:hypothetical protein C2E23DRAFT_845563 [Lenzites betulinus]
MSSDLSVNGFSTLEIARMLLEDLTSPAFTKICATDASNLEPFEETVAASYMTTRELINATQPINRLPPEILTKIFFQVQSQLLYQNGEKALPVDFMFDVRDLRPLVLTCRHWRTLITGTPFLWSTVMDLHIRRRRNLDLSRHSLKYVAGGSDLYLYMSATGERGGVAPEVLDICRRNTTASRVRGIFLECGNVCSGECYLILHSALPNLEYCCITNTLGCQKIGSLQRKHRRRLLPRSPKLNTLILNLADCPRELVIPTTPFPALTTLRIDKLLYSRDCAALLRFLCGTPRLQELVLQSGGADFDKEFDLVGRVPLRHLRTLKISCLVTDPLIISERTQDRPLVEGRCQFLSRTSLTPSCMDHIELTNIPLNALRTVLEAVDASGGTDSVHAKSINLQHEGYANNENYARAFSLRVITYLPQYSLTVRCADACKITLTFVAATSQTKDSTTDDQSPAQHLTAAQQACAHLCDLFSATSMFSGLRGLWLSEATWLTCVPPHNVLRFLPQLTMLVVDRVRDESDNAYGAATNKSEAHDPRSILEELEKRPDLTALCPLLHTLAIFCGFDSEAGFDYTAAGILAQVQEVARSRVEAGCPLACVVAIRVADELDERGDDIQTLRAAEYEYGVGCEEGLKLVREYESIAVIYQVLKAKWELLTR